MILQRRTIILLFYCLALVVAPLIRYPLSFLGRAKIAFSTIANTEELYVLDLLSFGSVSATIGKVGYGLSFFYQLQFVQFLPGESAYDSSVIVSNRIFII